MPETAGVADPETRAVRILSEMCSTCIMRPGNLMRLKPGRLRALLAEVRRNDSYVTCHQTLPYGPRPHPLAAICRGVADAVPTGLIVWLRRSGLLREVAPPNPSKGAPDDAASRL